MTCACGKPAIFHGWCSACIAKERAWRAPYAATAMEALRELGWDDLSREVWRRMAVYDMPLPFDGEATWHLLT